MSLKDIEHHVEEEEGELFKKARQALSEEEIETLGEQLQEANSKIEQPPFLEWTVASRLPKWA